MNRVHSKDTIEKLINENKILLIYFGSKDCGICKVIKPELEKILKAYPKITSVQVDVENNIKLSASYNVFTLPAILVFIDGKEFIREARYINMKEINDKIDRYYKLAFDM